MTDTDPTIPGVMSDPTRNAFDAEIARLRASNTSGPLDRAIGLARVVAGEIAVLPLAFGLWRIVRSEVK